MTNKKYTIKYSDTFIKQFNGIIRYFKYKLQNKIAAENFYFEVIKEIEERSKSPESFEKYNSRRKRKDSYYRIYVKNYIVLYIVKDDVMEVRRILSSRRNFDSLI